MLCDLLSQLDERTETSDGWRVWLSDVAWAAIEPLLPTVYPGARRKDDRRIISGIIHVLRNFCRWQDCPAVYGPSTTVYNRFNRWSRSGRWLAIFEALLETVPKDVRSIDSTSIKVQRAAAAEKGGRGAGNRLLRGGRTTKIHAICDGEGRLFRFLLTPGNVADITAAYELVPLLPSQGCLIGDAGYDAQQLRQDRAFRGTATVIPTNRLASIRGRSIGRPTNGAISSSGCSIG